MNYTIKSINTEHKFLFFWGHQPAKDGTITKTCFSQWYESPFVVGGISYKTAEHWMMAKKAALFNDNEILEKIIHSKTPDEAKKLGREVKNYDDALWLANRFEIVKEGNYHKFSQNPDLKTFLTNTKERILVEASPVDAIWGIGMASDHKDSLNPEKWRGLNLLGFALMEVRDELKEELYYFFIKFGEKEHLENLMRKGEVYFNTSENYNKIEAINTAQGDKYEGAELIVNEPLKEIYVEHPEFGKISFKPDLGNFDIINYNFKFLTSSFYQISPNSIKKKKIKIDEKMLGFNDYALIITEPFKFINLLKKEANSKNLYFKSGKVNYKDFKNKSSLTSIFDKKIEHSYQEEYRFVINNINNESYKINIGSIETFCILLPAKTIVSPDFFNIENERKRKKKHK